MKAALAPVQAGPQQRPGAPLQPVHLDAEPAELARTARAQRERAVLGANQAAVDQRLGDRDPDRAREVVVAHPCPAQAPGPARVAERADLGGGREQDEDLQCVGYRLGRDRVQLLPAAGDRKSTRLNSSHMSISYAVFCLKKKKRTN